MAKPELQVAPGNGQNCANCVNRKIGDSFESYCYEVKAPDPSIGLSIRTPNQSWCPNYQFNGIGPKPQSVGTQES